jgi:glycosyltransferase involved in cell wall biosynthesis
MTIRVGVDITLWPTRRGNGRFVRNVVPRLVELHPEDEWTLYADADTAAEIELPGATVRAVTQRRRPADTPAAGSPRGPIDLLRLSLAGRRPRHDAFLFPSVISYYPVIGVPSVVKLDASAETHTRLLLPYRRDRVLWRLKQWLALRSADRLFTTSEFARDQVWRHLGVDRSALAVAPLAADPAFVPKPRAEVDSTLAEFGLSREEGYLLTFAGKSLHKDPDTVLRAYAAIFEPGATPPLVVAGAPRRHTPDTAIAKLKRRAASLGLRESVRFPGTLTDQPLACMYCGATAVVLPSIIETFALCAVEAAACGTPVIASGIEAHRATLGAPGLFFPAGDDLALRPLLQQVLGADEVSRRQLGERCRVAASRFSWDETARRIHRLIAEVALRR